MILFKKAADLRNWLGSQQEKGFSIGFVPTMGALHAGHISLIRQSNEENLVTVCSIFVNPTQFNQAIDFEKYPVTIEKDISLLEESGCHILFLPSVKEMYPDGVQASMHYNLGQLEKILEGKFRPGHFQGVCMVVHRLLDIVKPTTIYLGQKDYQQCMVISKLVELIDMPVHINIAPTLRETDGLAMSSRNMRLNKEERKTAATISQTLFDLKKNLAPGDLSVLKEAARLNLETAGFKIDYIEIANAGTLSKIDEWDGKEKLVAVIAAFLHEVRLIDNMVLN